MTNSKELKEKIIKEILPNLSIDPYGGYVDAGELSKKTYDSVEDFYFRIGPEGGPKSVMLDPENILTREDYKEISWAIVEDVIHMLMNEKSKQKVN